ncbi:efflux RND transporter permease subunit [Acanthopleuribacter pedis]|uniref:Efflux RND transporter permease subunit n=1 Tax=Acanthopleuribacter pedis TaxID=442870 RepID=A0A8J7U5G0_9BACT|nr:efflux RND transporter permease subunit [Acanthopleuribacter pedis]MBO1321692.1 efflux RND transporter permease subunit [Acanthopleuribacter pedis]
MISFFTKHPTAANLLMAMLLIMGLVAIPTLQRETFPNFIVPLVNISIAYPGATAGEVEEAVIQRVEDAVDGVAYVKEVTAKAQEGVGVITVEAEEDADFQAFLGEVKTQIEAINDFPDQVEEPIIETSGDKQQVVSIAVTGDLNETDLKAYSEMVKDRLQQLPDISLVSISGFSDHQLRIEVPTARLLSLGLSPSQLADRVAGQSLDMAAGTMETDERNLVVRLMEERRRPEALRNLVIAGNRDGGEVRLGDIATISDRFDLDEAKVLFNGRRAAMLKIEKTTNQDALTIYDRVTQFVETEQAQAPHGVTLTITRDLTSISRDRLQMLIKNAWQGLLLVFFTLWLFFNWRLSFWVTMGLPVSFLGAFFILPQIGMTINMITMVGLLLALGLLMDDAIVIAENVATHLRKGENAMESVINGVSEVKAGVISSFITTIAVFGPITMLSGNLGKVLRVMPIVLIVVIFVSLIEAFLILPNHLAHSMSHPNALKVPPWRQRFDAGFERLREKVVGRLVDRAIHYRYLTLGLVIAVFVGSLAMFAGGILKFQAFPSIDGEVLEARVLLPQGTPLKKTEAVVAKLVDAIKAINEEDKAVQPDGQNLVKHINVQYNQNADAGVSGTHVATVSLDLLHAETRVGTLNELKDRWRAKTGEPADVLQINYTEPNLGPAGNPIEIQIAGEDLDRMKAASHQLQSFLDTFVGVADLKDDLKPGKPELQVRLKEGTYGLGITAASVAEQLRTAYFGRTAREIQVNQETYEIDVRLDQEDRNSITDLESFYVTLPNGRQTQLTAIAEVSMEGRGYGRINRMNGRRSLTITGDVDTDKANVAELMRTLKSAFLPQFKADYPDLTMKIKGESEESGDTGSSLMRGMILGLTAVFVLLSFQFESYREPLIVMSAIPLSLVGAIWGHLLMGYPFTMPSALGFVSLMGVVVNDSILLVTFIKNRRAEGQDIIEAARGAARDRFRAVLLTSLTTIAGLMPLLTETSMQAQIMIPLAISLIFGMAASTVLVLVVVPTLFTIVYRNEPAPAPETPMPMPTPNPTT